MSKMMRNGPAFLLRMMSASSESGWVLGAMSEHLRVNREELGRRSDLHQMIGGALIGRPRVDLGRRIGKCEIAGRIVLAWIVPVEQCAADLVAGSVGELQTVCHHLNDEAKFV